MRISDWSSDVCSSDLPAVFVPTEASRPSVCASYIRWQYDDSARTATRPRGRKPVRFDHVTQKRETAGLATGRSGIPCVSEGQAGRAARARSEEHTSELQSLMRISYAVFCLKKKNKIKILSTIAITTLINDNDEF